MERLDFQMENRTPLASLSLETSAEKVELNPQEKQRDDNSLKLKTPNGIKVDLCNEPGTESQKPISETVEKKTYPELGAGVRSETELQWREDSGSENSRRSGHTETK